VEKALLIIYLIIDHMKNKILSKILLCCGLLLASDAVAQNPYLPLWEHIPDGEPYVFNDPDNPGRQRLYIYGSHDILRNGYCGRDQVVWSAPLDDLSKWRYDGVIFESKTDAKGALLHAGGYGDILFAPDVTVVTDKNGKKTYYLYPNNQSEGRQSMVAKSDRPDGPFQVCNWSLTNSLTTEGILNADPAVFTDADGRVYGYWGYMQSWAGELDTGTMATLKKGGQRIENFIPSLQQDETFRFFEASSMRKIEDKYVFIYSRWTRDGEFGLPGTNYTLAYAYSDYPLGPYTYGGTLIDGRARGVDENGHVIPTANPTGNTHGSLCEINGKWYVFYHRQTGLNEYSRQAMVAPVEVKVEKGLGGSVSITEGEYTSEGFATDGLDPQKRYPAGIACYLTCPEPTYRENGSSVFSGSYVEATYVDGIPQGDPYDLRVNSNPVVNNTDGSVVGFKYFNLDKLSRRRDVKMLLNLKPTGVGGQINVMIDSPWASRGGKHIGTLALTAGKSAVKARDFAVKLQGLETVKGKHAVYFVFCSPTKKKSLCTFYQLVVQSK
jgi:arabinoxylan arabinofuranohydrolase